MKRFTAVIEKHLLENGNQQHPLRGIDNEIDFGLCDLLMAFPDLGAVIITELRALRGRLGLSVEHDLYFKAGKTLSDHAAEGSRLGRISA